MSHFDLCCIITTYDERKSGWGLERKKWNPTVKSLYVCLVALIQGYLRRFFGREPDEATMPLKFRPKLPKIVELLLYLAQKRPGADKYQAVKFFYLADRLHLQRYGRPITNEDYFALWYGPVASNALNLLQGDKWVMKSAGLDRLPFATKTGIVRSKSGKETETIFLDKPLREPNLDLFSETDLEVFDEILAEYGDASFEELYNLTHNHFAYDHAWNTRRKGDRAEMYYDEMIDDEKKRAALVEDFGPVASRMK